MYVKSLFVKDLRCFKSTTIALNHPGRTQETMPFPNVNLLLGDNGVGKSTILKAISLAVLSDMMPGSGYVPYSLVRRTREADEDVRSAEVNADLVLHSLDVEGTGADRDYRSTLRIRKVRQRELFEQSSDQIPADASPLIKLYDDDSAAFLLVGYGATRWAISSSGVEPFASQHKRRLPRYQRVAGLFEDQVGLNPLSVWLPELERKNRALYSEVGDLINELLPDNTRFLGRREDDEYLFKHHGVAVPQGALSDGYRAYLGWITDLLHNLCLALPSGMSLRDRPGVVLVDEVDLLLHPDWQRTVVPTLAKALPNLQFVLTTHSPIVAGTLTSQNIFVLDMDDSGISRVRQLKEAIHGLNADQVLLSSYFNLATTRAPGMRRELRQLSKRAMAGDRDAAVGFLEKLVAGYEDESEE